ncbi:hypothetical protein SR41_17395 [Sphingomonas melonis]|uniref:Uncharacterized protein n=1 Tax=Sphingomonas melonis TaxID=152682 RepID=A0A0D1M1S1_9SPHN|nr:hypothetical protein SR41_17395 [Sphingomonas melonis]
MAIAALADVGDHAAIADPKSVMLEIGQHIGDRAMTVLRRLDDMRVGPAVPAKVPPFRSDIECIVGHQHDDCQRRENRCANAPHQITSAQRGCLWPTLRDDQQRADRIDRGRPVICGQEAADVDQKRLHQPDSKPGQQVRDQGNGDPDRQHAQCVNRQIRARNGVPAGAGIPEQDCEEARKEDCNACDNGQRQ